MDVCRNCIGVRKIGNEKFNEIVKKVVIFKLFMLVDFYIVVYV